MLTPMLVQYLVALCCLRANPDAIDVVVGDMVPDAAAEKDRDVDVTVTIRDSDGTTSAFKAFEVKREGARLDVIAVEQMCLKLNDMPSITHRAIVSASGYTAPAVKKANAHGVTLYVMKPWTRPLAEQFPEFVGVGRPDEFVKVSSALLYWVHSKLHLVAPEGPSSFSCGDADPMLDNVGGTHQTFGTLRDLRNALLLRSTQVLYSIEPAQTVLNTFPFMSRSASVVMETSASWPHTHTLDVSADDVFMKLQGRLAKIAAVTISGHLQWQRRKQNIEFQILENVVTGGAFAAAAMAEFGTPDGRMFAMVFAPGSRKVNTHNILLEEKHRNMIRQLRVPLPSDA